MAMTVRTLERDAKTTRAMAAVRASERARAAEIVNTFADVLLAQGHDVLVVTALRDAADMVAGVLDVPAPLAAPSAGRRAES